MAKETLVQLAARIEAACRKLHRAEGSPRLMGETTDPATGVTTVHVLERPVFTFDAQHTLEILDVAYVRTGLGGQLGETPFIEAAQRYLDDLIHRASFALLEAERFGSEAETLKAAKISRVRFSKAQSRVRGKLRQTLWAMKLQGGRAVASFYAILWRHLDRDAARLTFKLQGGKEATLSAYRLVRVHREVLLQLERESGQLMPLIAAYCAPFVTDGLELDRGTIGRIKQHLKEQGLTEAGWRVLARMGAGALFVWRGIPLGSIELVNRLAIHGPHKIPATLLRWYRGCRAQSLLSGCEPEDFSFERTPRARRNQDAQRAYALSESDATRILGLMLEQALVAKRRHRIKHFISEELSLLEDALLGSLGTLILPRQLNWKWLMRFQARWHEESLVRKVAIDDSLTWESHLGPIEEGAYSIEPLTSAGMLYSEGQLMRHCVYSYTNSCLQNTSRIFSVRMEGKTRPIATAELRRDDKRDSVAAGEHWRVAQVKGFANGKVSAQVRDLIGTACRRYNKLCAEDSEDHTLSGLALAA